MNTLSNKDKAQLLAKGISEEQIEEQLESLRTGFPFLKLKNAATIGDGILRLETSEAEVYTKAWEAYKAEGHRITKFVPASGAASRMFKNLFEFLNATYSVPSTSFEQTFFDCIGDFAFFPALDEACRKNNGRGVMELVAEGEYKAVVSNLLLPQGLNYGNLPKGLLDFHSYTDGVRTPVEEHLTEAALYASSGGEADVHFTVSAEHRTLFQDLVKRVLPKYSTGHDVRYQVSFSEQKPSTDTVASNPDGTPFRTDEGELLFRPGGHGALLANLNDLPSDIVFIKNIDNVVPDSFKADTIQWKQVLAGVLVKVQQQAFDFLRLLDSGEYTQNDLSRMLDFVRHTLCCDKPDLRPEETLSFIRTKLNRPMRVCGVVENVGEPGGGPFLAFNPDGSVSPQILESSQIDSQDASALRMFENGTHFNPVDLVCAIKNYQGQKFDLLAYTDPATAFISHKSKSGRELLALELPGLWNGAMSDWSTIMVEVPLSTFNPVKTVNDLLRPQHQNKSL